MERENSYYLCMHQAWCLLLRLHRKKKNASKGKKIAWINSQYTWESDH